MDKIAKELRVSDVASRSRASETPSRATKVYTDVNNGDHIELRELSRIDRELGESIVSPLPIPVLDGDVLSFYVAKLAQRHPNFLGTGGLTSRIGVR